MSAGLKTTLAWATSILLVFAAWTAAYQMKSVVFSLYLGIAGMLMMFGAEFLYSYRKRGHFRFGALKQWLRAHIAVGLGGPAVILWHTGLNFHGFAGWLAALTGVVVVSGFTGRYIYRQIPRSLKGRELSLRELDEVRAKLECELGELIDKSPDADEVLVTVQRAFPRLSALGPAGQSGPKGPVAVGSFGLLALTLEWSRGRFAARHDLARRYPGEFRVARDLGAIEIERLGLLKRVHLLALFKKMLKWWRLMHIPLTLTLFAGVLIHVVSVLYYGKVLP